MISPDEKILILTMHKGKDYVDSALCPGAEGYQLQEIADLLFISIRTVENHRANIMRKLNINKPPIWLNRPLPKATSCTLINENFC